MNLKDRMKSDIPNQTLSESETIQQLSSEKLELTSVIADLRAELSSVQKINQSLTTNNQLLVKQNDDLRNNAGLVSRKEQEKLAKELTNTRGLLSEANKKINMSNIETVEAAQAAQKAAEQKAAKDIADTKKLADNKVSEAVKTKDVAIKQANEKIKAANKNRQIAQGSLFITLLCCIIIHPAILSDARDMVYLPAIWVWESLSDIESALLSLACIVGGSFAGYRLWIYYRKRWCALSQRVLLASHATIIVFGDIIHKIANINLVLLVIIIQILYLGLLIYLDDYFETHNRTYAWIRIQNS